MNQVFCGRGYDLKPGNTHAHTGTYKLKTSVLTYDTGTYTHHDW